MNVVRFVCYDERCEDNGVPPLIAIFSLDDCAKSQDMIKVFHKTLFEFAPGFEDCPPMRYAADKVCERFGATVEFVEADHVFKMPDCCHQCGWAPGEDATDDL